MEALYVWLEDGLNQRLVKFCNDNKQKKAHVVRVALGEYLGENNGPDGKDFGMETNVPKSELGEQQVS